MPPYIPDMRALPGFLGIRQLFQEPNIIWFLLELTFSLSTGYYLGLLLCDLYESQRRYRRRHQHRDEEAF
jgi:hypothetical protein